MSNYFSDRFARFGNHLDVSNCLGNITVVLL